MIDISAFINDPQLRPALIGLIGVGVGGLMTVTGQSVSRRAERNYKMRQDVAQALGLSHSLRSLFVSYHSNPFMPEDVVQKTLDKMNADRPELLNLSQLLMMTAPRSIAKAAHGLAETITAVDNYQHPSLGDGKKEGFKQISYFGRRIADAEFVLSSVSRSFWWFRPIRFRLARHKAEVAAQKDSNGTDN